MSKSKKQDADYIAWAEEESIRRLKDHLLKSRIHKVAQENARVELEVEVEVVAASPPAEVVLEPAADEHVKVTRVLTLHDETIERHAGLF